MLNVIFFVILFSYFVHYPIVVVVATTQRLNVLSLTHCALRLINRLSEMILKWIKQTSIRFGGCLIIQYRHVGSEMLVKSQWALGSFRVVFGLQSCQELQTMLG
jgi:hypothetical protein